MLRVARVHLILLVLWLTEQALLSQLLPSGLFQVRMHSSLSNSNAVPSKVSHLPPIGHSRSILLLPLLNKIP